MPASKAASKAIGNSGAETGETSPGPRRATSSIDANAAAATRMTADTIAAENRRVAEAAAVEEERLQRLAVRQLEMERERVEEEDRARVEEMRDAERLRVAAQAERARGRSRSRTSSGRLREAAEVAAAGGGGPSASNGGITLEHVSPEMMAALRIANPYATNDLWFLPIIGTLFENGAAIIYTQFLLCWCHLNARIYYKCQSCRVLICL